MCFTAIKLYHKTEKKSVVKHQKSRLFMRTYGILQSTTYIKRKETSDKVQVNFEKTEYLRTNMMNSEYCFSYIKDGAITVNDW